VRHGFQGQDHRFVLPKLKTFLKQIQLLILFSHIPKYSELYPKINVCFILEMQSIKNGRLAEKLKVVCEDLIPATCVLLNFMIQSEYDSV
jgi:hypothetical protein